jgi:hypothetical protein
MRRLGPGTPVTRSLSDGAGDQWVVFPRFNSFSVSRLSTTNKPLEPGNRFRGTSRPLASARGCMYPFTYDFLAGIVYIRFAKQMFPAPRTSPAQAPVTS